MEKDTTVTIPTSSRYSIPQTKLVDFHFLKHFSEVVREVFYNEQQETIEKDYIEKIEKELGLSF